MPRRTEKTCLRTHTSVTPAQYFRSPLLCQGRSQPAPFASAAAARRGIPPRHNLRLHQHLSQPATTQVPLPLSGPRAAPSTTSTWRRLPAVQAARRPSHRRRDPLVGPASVLTSFLQLLSLTPP
ncbi:hypothetical protein NL676_029851 [Syzygium grande]|nr:hypothetical protein NL676_029851 [Syzygium grande]